MICFLAFLLERTLELKLKNARITASPETIREALNAMTFTKVQLDNNVFYIKNKGTELSNPILRALNMKPPKNLLAEEELKLLITGKVSGKMYTFLFFMPILWVLIKNN